MAIRKGSICIGAFYRDRLRQTSAGCYDATMPRPPTDEELTQFGIRPEDDGIHPHDPAAEWWNESWFWDWFDDAGEVAGHCRLGFHPVQRRAWL